MSRTFLDCSFGFRPGRSAHQALQAVWKGSWDGEVDGCWMLMYANTSPASRTPSSGSFLPDESRMV